ncbi:hypothetical protein TEA_022725 [Camellia sinensis var. sinensis]|uniref:Uncharacterized protein n=1 Tax=Camellia sinensis var. sinensis TaxID=542762 RepID=A0A4S4F007_CAMSN|nr:hypothetical protein TEA_022725 [Camellia sinensis var. sinensis]
MKDDDALPISTPTAHTHTHTHTHTQKETSDSSPFGKGRYKFWALSAILLLAFWSMLTGTVSLRWSAGNLNRFSDDFDIPIHDDLDVLEMEEREKVVKHMWDVYTNSRRIRLPRFWQEAFEAAYEDLMSDAPGVREAAISDIAKMSLRSIDFELSLLQSLNWSSVSDQSDLGTVTWKPENTISATWAEFDWRSPSDAKAMNPGRGIESKAMQ